MTYAGAMETAGFGAGDVARLLNGPPQIDPVEWQRYAQHALDAEMAQQQQRLALMQQTQMNQLAGLAQGPFGYYPPADPAALAGLQALLGRTVPAAPVDPKIAAERAAALKRAEGLLEEKIGGAAMAKLANGGGYTVRSKAWPDVVYVVPKDPHQRIRVVDRGAVVTESCLVTRDPTLPWPDIMLQRITAVEVDESVVYATGVLHRGSGRPEVAVTHPAQNVAPIPAEGNVVGGVAAMPDPPATSWMVTTTLAVAGAVVALFLFAL